MVKVACQVLNKEVTRSKDCIVCSCYENCPQAETGIVSSLYFLIIVLAFIAGIFTFLKWIL